LPSEMSSPRTMSSTSYSAWPHSESSPASPYPPPSLCNTTPDPFACVPCQHLLLASFSPPQCPR
jgi:hypothetical protein